MTDSKDSFYTSVKYKQKQSEITKNNWRLGIYKSLVRIPILRPCLNPDCKNRFSVKQYDSKIYCSHHCAATIGNLGRIQSTDTRSKISSTLYSLPKPTRFYKKKLVELICQRCRHHFKVLPYIAKRQKYCSVRCHIITLGRKTTSPKASKGKNGVRVDIDPDINFYSTWEANVARVYNFLSIKWVYAPKLFDLGKHTYRPDFYLPNSNEYVEVKNFMSKYSRERDTLFRKKFPKIKLNLILKDDYLEIKSNYQDLVEKWEN